MQDIQDEFVQKINQMKKTTSVREDVIISHSSDENSAETPSKNSFQNVTSNAEAKNSSKKHIWIENSKLMQQNKSRKKKRKRKKNLVGSFLSVTSKSNTKDSPIPLTLKRASSPIVSTSKKIKTVVKEDENESSPVLPFRKKCISGNEEKILTNPIQSKRKLFLDEEFNILSLDSQSDEIEPKISESSSKNNTQEKNPSLEIEELSTPSIANDSQSKNIRKDESIIIYKAPIKTIPIKKKRRKPDKESISYKLSTFTKNLKSDVSVWQHEMFLASKGKLQVPDDNEKSSLFKVVGAYETSEHFMINCVKVDTEDKYTIFVNDDFVTSLTLKIGGFVRLYQPFFTYPYIPKGGTEAMEYFITNACKIQPLNTVM